MGEHEISSSWVDVRVAGDNPPSTMPAYLSRPSEPGTYPTVLVGFEMFGITGYIRSVADRIARQGYTAVAPDFYHRLGDERIELAADADGRASGLALLQRLDRGGVIRDVRAVVDGIAAPSSSGLAAFVGLSVGGHIAFYAATQIPFAALVVFYPGWLTDSGIALSRPEPTLGLAGAIADLGTPVLFLLGDGDHLFTAEARDQIAERLRVAGVRHELVVYPGAPHGFLCHERDTYRPDVADDAWRRVTALLGSELGRTP